MQVVDGLADASKRFGVPVVVQANGVTTSGVLETLVAAVASACPRPIEAFHLDFEGQ